MGKRIKKLRQQRLHSEGSNILIACLVVFTVLSLMIWYFFNFTIIFWIVVCIFIVTYSVMLNFFRCPIRYLDVECTTGLVVAPADGRVVVVEEVLEDEYFHGKRIMVSIFMNLFNVHANWFPVEGEVTMVKHQNGNFHKAWLPKASEENEHADVMIRTPEGVDVLCRQIAGAVARRIITYAKQGEPCEIDDHLGFIKFGSRVDIFLPVDSEVLVKMGDLTIGDQTIIAKMA